MQNYIVQVGDTLYGISKQFGVSLENIKLTNNLKNNNILPGQVLLIPSLGTTTLYIVRVGDTLYSIANKFNTTVNDLISLNNLTTDKLKVGQQLRIPINNTNSNDSYYIYVVKPGDTLYSIARSNNVTVDMLRVFNNLNSNLLAIGQQIKIPSIDIPSSDDDYLIYVVRAGDSLYSIAKKYGMSVNDLIEINNLSSNILSIGQNLKIVSSQDNAIPLGSSCYGEGYTEPMYITYTVKSGDNLYNIANKYNVSVDSIKKLNNLMNNNLSIGQILKIKEVIN